jgi:glycerol-1-phosphate dehydrogenase [NAD(P)+]
VSLPGGRGAAAAPSLAAKGGEIARLLGRGEVAARAREETAAKHVEGQALAARLGRLRAVWPGLAARIAARGWTAERLAAHLRAAGAAAEPADIGLAMADLRRSVPAARFLRRRYTVLDLLEETGLLRRAVAEALPDRPRTRVAV